jgi:multiple sugar transport system permease protein
MGLWGVGSGTIILLAGLQGIPNELYEAATIDGAGAWPRFWNVTIPMLSPTLFFTLITGIIGTLNIFTSAYIMTKGGPNFATYFYALNIYFTAFRYLRLGYASALAFVMFLLILGLTLLVFSSGRYWVYYAGEREEAR